MNTIKKGDKLINQLISEPIVDGVLSNKLLSNFFNGYPLTNLHRLLFHNNTCVQEVGAWIASELGIECKPIFKDVIKLIDYESVEIRCALADCVLVCAEKEDREAIAKVILYLTDSNLGVIWQVMQLLTRSSINQLQWGLSYFEDVIKDSIHIKGLNFLINSNKKNTKEIVSLLNDKNTILRKYGLACARKVFAKNNKPLKLALTCEDEDIKNIAKSFINLIPYDNF